MCITLHTPHNLLVFFFNDPAPTEIYPLPLPDALPICPCATSATPRPTRRGQRPTTYARSPASAPPWPRVSPPQASPPTGTWHPTPRSDSRPGRRDRKSTRLNSSHQIISYAVFCLKKKN